MSRGLPSALATASISAVFRAAYFVELAWPSGTVRVWTGLSTIDWGGHTWTGAGNIGSIGTVSESTDGRANTLELKLSGIPSGDVALALANDFQGRDAKIYLGALDAAGALVSDPQIIFAGFMDYTVIADDGVTASISLMCAKEMSRRRAMPRRYTHEDQQIDQPGDMFFEFLAGNSAQDFAWGRQGIPAAPVSPGSGEDGFDNFNSGNSY